MNKGLRMPVRAGFVPGRANIVHRLDCDQSGRVILWLLGAIVGALAIVGYWYLDTRGYLDRISLPDSLKESVPQTRNTTRPVYRWHDDQGRLQITDQPPVGRPFEEVTYRKDANVIPSEPDKTR